MGRQVPTYAGKRISLRYARTGMAAVLVFALGVVFGAFGVLIAAMFGVVALYRVVLRV